MCYQSFFVTKKAEQLKTWRRRRWKYLSIHWGGCRNERFQMILASILNMWFMTVLQSVSFFCWKLTFSTKASGGVPWGKPTGKGKNLHFHSRSCLTKVSRVERVFHLSSVYILPAVCLSFITELWSLFIYSFDHCLCSPVSKASSLDIPVFLHMNNLLSLPTHFSVLLIIFLKFFLLFSIKVSQMKFLLVFQPFREKGKNIILAEST